MKLKTIISLGMVTALAALVLSGCGQNKISEETKKVDDQNKKNEQKVDANKGKTLVQQEKFYKKYEKPIDQSVKEVNADKVQVITQRDVTQPLPEYKDPVEFAKYTGKILYGFYTLQISPEQYYQFLKQYGSTSVIKSLPSEEDSIKVFTSLQEMFKKKNTEGKDYELTVPVLDRLKQEGHFYRKTTTIQGDEYFQTTIVKEQGVWKYSADGTAPPYEVSSPGTQETNK